ncbi:hypothetical protein [Tsukamurella pseudospumae]|uniref:Uncharacterized protein n=1 Tax=Tsukamurella pseudospumae TaxID=239498 RepID=A0A137ZRA3_9ACTN|nr:hypothetical protein [Tsukamurella pseudospumae]KXP00704.1 hypothetical protein AXK61_14465 [Tsukamurella pseudospumae]
MTDLQERAAGGLRPGTRPRDMVRSAVVWGVLSALVAGVFRAPQQSPELTVLLSVVLTVLCSMFAMRLSGGRATHVVGTLSCAVIIGASVQVRLGASPARIVVLSVIAACVFILSMFLARWMSASSPSRFARVAGWAVVGCFIARVILPIPLDVSGLSYLVGGTGGVIAS